MADVITWSLSNLPPQHDRVVVVTGANSGIGLEASRGLAALGATVIMACRSEERGHAAAVDIRSTVPGSNVEVRPLDLADLSSVSAFAASFGTDDRLDLLINNAGVMALPERRETADGFEMQLGTNVLGHFALTARLLPKLLAAKGSRVTWLSSLAHRQGTINFDDLQSERRYSPWVAYQQSKLGDLVLAIEMQRRLTDAGHDMLSVAAHPGLSSTNLASEMIGGSGLKAALMSPIFKLAAMPAWKGALPTLVAALNPKVRPADYIGPDGPFEVWGSPKSAEIKPKAEDRETGKRLWAVCEELTGASMTP